jgi:RNA polymerase sigma-70 factor, ECF subfamily
MTTVEIPLAHACREYGALLARIAHRLCGNDSDAADLVQDTYERALRAQDRYNDCHNPRSWMVTVLHHLFIDRCRRMRCQPRTEAVDDLIAPEPNPVPAWSDITRQQVDAALSTIGLEFRQVFDLHVRGRTYGEIAAELNLAKATVGTRLHRARRKLKNALMRELEGGTHPRS